MISFDVGIKMMSDFAISPELILCEPRAAHAEAFFKIIDENRDHLSPWMAWLPDVKHPNDTARFLEECQHKNKTKQGFVALIQLSQKFVGTVSLDGLNRANNAATLGYWIAQSAQGRGVATASAKLALDYGFRELTLNKIVVCCATGNLRSAKVIERLGFTREGVLRESELVQGRYQDQLIFSLLRAEWLTHSYSGAKRAVT